MSICGGVTCLQTARTRNRKSVFLYKYNPISCKTTFVHCLHQIPNHGADEALTDIPSVPRHLLSRTDILATSFIAIYTASAVEPARMLCFLLFIRWFIPPLYLPTNLSWIYSHGYPHFALAYPGRPSSDHPKRIPCFRVRAIYRRVPLRSQGAAPSNCCCRKTCALVST